jgi:hypothetical protein
MEILEIIGFILVWLIGLYVLGKGYDDVMKNN